MYFDTHALFTFYNGEVILLQLPNDDELARLWSRNDFKSLKFLTEFDNDDSDDEDSDDEGLEVDDSDEEDSDGQ
jgi:hypothetical protein